MTESIKDKLARIEKRNKEILEEMKKQKVVASESYDEARQKAKEREGDVRKMGLESARELAKRANRMLNRF